MLACGREGWNDMYNVVLTVAAAALAVAACDIQRTGQQLTADKVMVAAILATPSVTVSPAALAGADAGFGAGGMDGGQLTIPGQTLALAYFLERPSSFDAPPAPVSGATMAVKAEGGAAIALEPTGDGAFSLSSAQSSALEYASGATYDFEATLAEERYVGRVAEAPQLENVAALHPPEGYVDHWANEPFTFTRPEPPAGQPRNLGFITIHPISDRGELGPPTYTNVPMNPIDFLRLVALPAPWRAAEMTVPASAFPLPNQTYALVLQAAKMGGPQSENLFTGSAIVAGTAEVGVFRTR
jgi:hypothetical protein